MTRRGLVAAGIVGWACVGGAVAVAGLSDVNRDARLVVIGAMVVGVVAALTAARCATVGHDRSAGLLLVVSVVMPTFFAWAINLAPLLVGALLLFDARHICGATPSEM